jgi:hypothetical protein
MKQVRVTGPYVAVKINKELEEETRYDGDKRHLIIARTNSQDGREILPQLRVGTVVGLPEQVWVEQGFGRAPKLKVFPASLKVGDRVCMPSLQFETHEIEGIGTVVFVNPHMLVARVIEKPVRDSFMVALDNARTKRDPVQCFYNPRERKPDPKDPAYRRVIASHSGSGWVADRIYTSNGFFHDMYAPQVGDYLEIGGVEHILTVNGWKEVPHLRFPCCDVRVSLFHFVADDVFCCPGCEADVSLGDLVAGQ